MKAKYRHKAILWVIHKDEYVGPQIHHRLNATNLKDRNILRVYRGRVYSDFKRVGLSVSPSSFRPKLVAYRSMI